MEVRVNIIKTVDGSKATLAIEGWLDTQTAPELGVALDQLGKDVSELEFDFSKLEYVSSAGLRQIMSAHKRMAGNLVITGVSDEIQEVFDLTGMSKRLKIQ